MPWTAEEFRKRHNKKLTKSQAASAARQANAILKKTGDEGKAIRIANSRYADNPGLEPVKPRGRS